MHCKYWRIAGSSKQNANDKTLRSPSTTLSLSENQQNSSVRVRWKKTRQSHNSISYANSTGSTQLSSRQQNFQPICLIYRDNTRKKIEMFSKFSTTTLYSATNALLADTLRKSHNMENAVELIMVVRIACLDVFLSTVKYRLRCQQLSKDTSNRPDI